MAALEGKVIASWRYRKGALDPKTGALCSLAVGRTLEGWTDGRG